MKAGTMKREEGQAAIDKLYAENFNHRELGLLKKSTSNAEFHYPGSAGVMAQIGKGFAEAMVQIIEK